MKNKLRNFNNALEDYGEFFFSLGSDKEDYEFITNTLKQQGYWAGVSYRLYFDNNLNLTHVESRF